MPYFKRCEIKNIYEEEQFEWKIDNFFSIAGTGKQIEHDGPSFSFREISCSTQLNRYTDSNGWWIMHVKTTKDEDDDGDRDVSKVECFLGFKKVDGSLDRSLLTGYDKEYDGEEEVDHLYDFSETELMERKHEFTTSDNLTISCTMKYGSSYYPQPKPDQPTFMKLTRLDTLSENFKNLFANKSSCDVSLQVKDKVFDAHKTILMAGSPVFFTMFEHDIAGKQKRTINIPDCDPESFQKFLKYLYCGKLEDISFQEVLHLYSISAKFNVKELKCFCVRYMEQCLTVDNVCDIIMLADKNDDVKLLSLARRFFCKNSSKIVNTQKWKSLLEYNSEFVNKLIIEMTSKIKI